MKTLIMSQHGLGNSMAYALERAGEDVRVVNPSSDYSLLGIVERVPGWRPSAAEWADLVIADEPGLGVRQAPLMGFKVPFRGVNPVVDLLATDRLRQREMAQRLKLNWADVFPVESSTVLDRLNLPWSRTSTIHVTPQSGGEFHRFQCKDPGTLTHVADALAPGEPLVLTKVPSGVELIVAGWMGQGGWRSPLFRIYDALGALNGCGARFGTTGAVMLPVQRESNLTIVANQFSRFLMASGYEGPAGVRVLCIQDKVLGLETLFGNFSDFFECLVELSNVPVQQIVGGAGPIKTANHHRAVSVRLLAPPFPWDLPDDSQRGTPIKGVPDKAANVHLVDTMKDRGELKWAASQGIVLKVTGSARTLKGALKGAYETIRRIEMLDAFYRPNIADGVEEAERLLRKWRLV